MGPAAGRSLAASWILEDTSVRALAALPAMPGDLTAPRGVAFRTRGLPSFMLGVENLTKVTCRRGLSDSAFTRARKGALRRLFVAAGRSWGFLLHRQGQRGRSDHDTLL